MSSITESLVNKYKNTHKDASLLSSQSADALKNDSTDEFASFWSSVQHLVSSTACGLAELVYRTGKQDFTDKERVEKLLIQKKTAVSYEQWLSACKELDELQNLNVWKQEKKSTLYDWELVEKNLMDLRHARESGDIKTLIYLIRTTWSRNVGNIGNENLYRHSHIGTKVLIEEYLHECQLALDMVTAEDNGIEDKYVLGMLTQTRKNIGRTALVLSGGGCFGMFHIGVLASLLETESLPRIVSGSSAGAIVASILCVHNKTELVELIGTIVEKNFDIFDDVTSKEGFLRCLSRLFKYGTWFDSQKLRETMVDFLGDLTFREAYYRTGKILNITVSPASVHEHPRLLNYLTAPSVLIWSAVCASCSLPGMFPSSTIYEKNPKTGATQEWNHSSIKFVDGSVYNDLPIARLSEMFNVDHIIACQVNPHVVPFLKLSVSCVGGEVEPGYSAILKTKLSQLYGVWSAEVSHYLEMSAEIGISRNWCTKFRSMLSQQYTGDITILPDLSEVTRLNKMLTNPSPEYLLEITLKGARATWPKVSIISNHCGLEFALDRAINKLKSRNFKDLTSHLTLVNKNSFSDSSKLLKAKSEQTKTNSKNHVRHRSETLTLGRLKTLRHVQSHISVTTSPTKRLTTPVNRFHRSYSASNENEGSFFYPKSFAVPTSEATSPAATRGRDEYFVQQGESPTKRGGTRSLIASRSSNFIMSTSSSSDHLFLGPSGAKSTKYNNIDDSDGLFLSRNDTASPSYDSQMDDDMDPVKVADQLSLSK